MTTAGRMAGVYAFLQRRPAHGRLSVIDLETGGGTLSEILKEPSQSIHIQGPVATGYRNFLKEILENDNPDDPRLDRETKKLREAIENEFPNFFNKERKKLATILRRGTIKSEAEFEIVRNEVENVETDETRQQELPELYSMLDKFESKQRDS